MQEQIVSFETAQLAKEKGFDWECFNFYAKLKSIIYGIDDQGRYYEIKNTPKKLYVVGEYAVKNEKNAIIAPTQSLLQKWLRDVHDLHVQAYPMLARWEFSVASINTELHFICPDKTFETYEQALEEGLQEALKLIKK